MKKLTTEFIVGLFIIAGVSAIAYLSIRIAGVSGFGPEGYKLVAKFENSSGLKRGSFVELAGVRVGRVESIQLDTKTLESKVLLEIDPGVPIQEDAVASIRTAGIIGDKFIKISPGGSDLLLTDGDEIIETESAINIEELVSKYMFDK